jgi:hypothetical protein
MPYSKRPEMYQTYIPFVEMYIRGIDILRSPSGKPRSLISFSHDIYAGAGGFWTLEIFDPEYVSVEELMVSTLNYAVTKPEDSGYGSDEGGGTDEEAVNVSTAHFRYGYLGHNQQERVVSTSPNGEEFFYGMVHSYIPTYETNGTRLVIRGDSSGSMWRRHPKIEGVFTGLSVYQVIEKICEERKWTLVPLGMGANPESSLPLQKRPEDFKKTDASYDTTEEEYPSFTIREGEDHVQFINRLCLEARPNDSKYDVFMCRLEYRTLNEKPETKPTGYLYFGPVDHVTQEPVRQYIYMRDPRSDIIQFSNNAQVWAAQSTGAAGVVCTSEDAKLGDIQMRYLDDINRYMYYDRESRPPVTFTSSMLEDVAYPEGEVGIEGADEKNEGGGSDPNRLSVKTMAKMSAPGAELPIATVDRRQADREAMQYWLTMQNWVTKGNLQIIGDPSPEIAPGNLITVLVLVPQGDPEAQKLAFHWTSSVWLIIGVNHEIRPGEMITNLELTRTGLSKGGATTKAAYRAFHKALTPGQLERTS